MHNDFGKNINVVDTNIVKCLACGREIQFVVPDFERDLECDCGHLIHIFGMN